MCKIIPMKLMFRIIVRSNSSLFIESFHIVLLLSYLSRFFEREKESSEFIHSHNYYTKNEE